MICQRSFSCVITSADISFGFTLLQEQHLETPELSLTGTGRSNISWSRSISQLGHQEVCREDEPLITAKKDPYIALLSFITLRSAITLPIFEKEDARNETCHCREKLG